MYETYGYGYSKKYNFIIIFIQQYYRATLTYIRLLLYNFVSSTYDILYINLVFHLIEEWDGCSGIGPWSWIKMRSFDQLFWYYIINDDVHISEEERETVNLIVAKIILRR